MHYKNAERCHKCPQRNDEQGCPWWWEFITTDLTSGNEQVVKKCGKAALPEFLTEVIRAANRPAAEISAMREQVTKSVVELAAVIGDGLLIGNDSIKRALKDDASDQGTGVRGSSSED